MLNQTCSLDLSDLRNVADCEGHYDLPARTVLKPIQMQDCIAGIPQPSSSTSGCSPWTVLQAIRSRTSSRRANLVVQPCVMRSADKVHFVSRDMPAIEALETMGREDVNQLPVMSDGRVEGIVSRAHVLQVVRSRAELKLPPSLPRAA